MGNVEGAEPPRAGPSCFQLWAKAVLEAGLVRSTAAVTAAAASGGAAGAARASDVFSGAEIRRSAWPWAVSIETTVRAGGGAAAVASPAQSSTSIVGASEVCSSFRTIT